MISTHWSVATAVISAVRPPAISGSTHSQAESKEIVRFMDSQRHLDQKESCEFAAADGLNDGAGAPELTSCAFGALTPLPEEAIRTESCRVEPLKPFIQEGAHEGQRATFNWLGN
jgi:hypothetical protein